MVWCGMLYNVPGLDAIAFGYTVRNIIGYIGSDLLEKVR
jgi:hypothetical protein